MPRAAGYIKSEEPAFEKTPDRRVRQAIELLFEKVVEIGSVRQTLLWFQEHGLEFPAHSARSEVQWKRPSYGCFYRLLTNPIYGGAYAYGKSVARDNQGENSASIKMRKLVRAGAVRA